MSKNPIVNAIVAAGYISLIVMFFSYATGFNARELGMIVPITFLSLFVLSAALMGYLFLFQPLQLFLANKQAEATRLFLFTVLSFAGIIVATLALYTLLIRFV